jgi:hypothetical protein
MHAQRTHLLDRGWFIEKLISTMSFGERTAFLLEDWSIVAEMPLDEVPIELNLDPELFVGRRDSARDEDQPIDVLGAEIVPGAGPSSLTGRHIIVLRLPSPLGPDESHNFQLRISVPAAGRIGHHLCQPIVRCRRLDVRVHFDRSAVPTQVLAVTGDHPQAHDLGPHSEVPVNVVGEVEISFEKTVLGRPYGLAWSRP